MKKAGILQELAVQFRNEGKAFPELHHFVMIWPEDKPKPDYPDSYTDKLIEDNFCYAGVDSSVKRYKTDWQIWHCAIKPKYCDWDRLRVKKRLERLAEKAMESARHHVSKGVMNLDTPLAQWLISIHELTNSKQTYLAYAKPAYYMNITDVFLDSAIACDVLLNITAEKPADAGRNQPAETPSEIKLMEIIAKELTMWFQEDSGDKDYPSGTVDLRLRNGISLAVELEGYLDQVLTWLRVNDQKEIARSLEKERDSFLFDLEAVENAIERGDNPPFELIELRSKITGLIGPLEHTAKVFTEKLAAGKPAETKEIPTLTEDEVEVLNYLKEQFPTIRYQEDINSIFKIKRDRKTIKALLDDMMTKDLVSRPENKSKGYLITPFGQEYHTEYYT